MEYKMLFSPMRIGSCEIKNRIVMSPMLMGFGQLDGKPTKRMLDYYEERARGGTGLIITEITRVNDRHGAAAFAQLAASHDYHIEGLREFAERIHRHGAKLFVQLHHPGRQNVGLAVGTVPLCIAATRVCKSFPKLLFKVAPKLGKTLCEKNLTKASVAPSACEPSYFAGGRVRALRHGEIKQLVRQFADAAVRCKAAGVDGVELHGTHGYLIQQFLSPHTNTRTDEYGGNFENRLRFLREIVEEIRKRCDDYPIIVRLTVDEFYDKIGREGVGYGLDLGVEYAKAIEKMGVDAIDVSSASYDTFNFWLEPTSFETGWRKYLAAAVKKEVKIPVLAANLIRSPEQAEAQLEEGIQDFVSLGRPHIADPHWANKAMHGENIRRCICCLNCIESMQENAYIGGHGHCSVNPEVGLESEMRELKRDGEGKTVVIIGAGVAGLIAAQYLGRRGFKPVVLEKNDIAGGQLLLAAAPPRKQKLYWAIEDLLQSAVDEGAELHFGVEADEEIIASYAPYAVIVATGANAVMPKAFEKYADKTTFTTTQVLTGEAQLDGKRVAIIGSGMTGLETAECLAERGCDLIIVDIAEKIAPGTWFQHVDDALARLNGHAEFLTSHRLESINESGILLQPIKYKGNKAIAVGETKQIDVDAVVLSLGARPENALYERLKGKYERLFEVGDACKIGRIASASAQAFDVAVNKIK